MVVVNKVIHRFVRDRADYEEGGALYNQIIPYNVQAYSYKLRENGNPDNPKDYIVAYVLGTGSSTYLEIANGRGKDPEGNPVPGLSQEFIIQSEEEIMSLLDEKVTHLTSLTGEEANLRSGEIVQYIGETSEDYTEGYFYKAIHGQRGFVVNYEDSRLTGISNIQIDQEKLRDALESYGLSLPLDFQADHTHYWTCVSPLGGSSLGIGEDVLHDIWGITWEGTPEYVTPGIFTVIDIEESDGEGSWLRVNTQPVEQSNVQDVQVDGESVVVDHVANIVLADRIKKLEELPISSSDIIKNEIVEYVGETTANYINGYFYKAIEEIITDSMLVPNVVSVVISDSDVTTDKTVFENYIHPTTNLRLCFVYNADTASWYLDEEAVDLANYGVTIDPSLTPENDDNLYLDYRLAVTQFNWVRINVQPETDVSNKQDKDDTEVYKVGFNGGWEDANSIIDAGSHIAKTNNADGTVTIDVDDITDTGLEIAADDTGLTTGKAVYEYGETKVNKTNTASKVYGTDAQGNQTTYSLDEFGAIDDVRVDGQSVVENQIANITLSDRIRKLAVLPTTPGSTSNGEIVEYVGTTTQDYTNGYFYKAASQPVASTLTPHIISSVIHDSDIATNISTFESYVHPLDDMELHFTYVSGESSWYLDDEVVNLASYGIIIDPLLTPNDSDELYIDYRTNTISYNWTRVNVQPTTTVVDNLTTQSSTDALSANMGYELNERIDAVEGRGRFLSVWDCSTGLPQTNPPVSPYEYHSGDYFIVGVASPAHPSEITQIVQTVGSTLSNLAVQDITDFESQLPELADTTLVFVYDNNNNWTLNGDVIDITDYSITYTGTPVEGDRIRVVYSAEVINYRPSGLQYVNNVASTVIETDDVVVNDTYIFDGTTWVLQASGQREVTFDSLAGSPYDNTNLAIALNAKVDDVQVDGTSVVTNGVASIDLTGKVDTTDSASKIYGTNAQGGQTLYDLDDFGQVDDVQLNGTSVVDANKIANIEPEASDIAYTHPDHPSLQTVEDALDHLLYIEPTVTLHLDQTLSAYEIGLSINSVGLIWSWNKTITSQSLNQGIGDLSTSTTSYTYTPANPIDSNITFTITGGDGVETATSSVSVSFMPKRYWGVSTLTSLTDADILNLSQELSTSRTQTRTFDCSGGKYFYFVIKTSYCNNIGFKVNGMTFSDMDVETRNFTNASGHTDQYNIYRVHNIQTGDNIPVEVL